MKKTILLQKKKSLLLKFAGLFDDPYEWCVLERIYFACNTQASRKWVARYSYLHKTTPIKDPETLKNTLNRLCEKGFGEKVPFGKPIQLRIKKDGEKGTLSQRFQYNFDQTAIDELISKMEKKVLGKPTSSPRNSVESVLGNPRSKSSEIRVYSQEDSNLLIEKEDSNQVCSVGGSPLQGVTTTPTPEIKNGFSPRNLSIPQEQGKTSESSEYRGVSQREFKKGEIIFGMTGEWSRLNGLKKSSHDYWSTFKNIQQGNEFIQVGRR